MLNIKDLGPTKKILGCKFIETKKIEIFGFLKKNYLMKILQCFNMKD